MFSDGEYRYSLCVVYTGNNGQNISYRVADYDPENGKYEDAHYTDRNDEYFTFEPTIIGAKPEELDYLEACIRRWKPRDDYDRKQWSYSYNRAEIYEVFFEKSLLEASDNEDIIEILASGISLPPYIKSNFLLPISQSGAEYEMMLCSPKDFVQKDGLFTISDSVSDMMHTTHQFKKYIIKRKDLVNNRELRRALNNDFVTDERVFYAYDKLPEPDGKFIPRSIETYITAYLKWYCRREKARLDINKRDMEKFFSILETVQGSDTEVMDFFKESPFNRDEIRDALAARQDSIIRFFGKLEDIDSVIKMVLRDNADLYAECIKVVTDAWMAEEATLREEEVKKTKVATAIKEAAEQEAVKAQAHVESLKYDAEGLSRQITILSDELEKKTEQKERIGKETKEQLEKFETDIVSTMKATGIFDFLSGRAQAAPPIAVNKGMYRSYQSASPFPVREPEEVTLEEFYEDFTENIDIWFDNASDIAALVMATMRNDLGVIVPSSVGIHVATAFSLMNDAQMPLELEVGSNWEDVYSAAEAVRKSTVKTVFFHGLLDDFREAAIGTIKRLCPDKHLFYGISDIRALNMMSKSIYDNALFIDISQYYKAKGEKRELFTSMADIGELIPRDVFRAEKYFNTYFAEYCRNGIVDKPRAVSAAQVIQYYWQAYSDLSLGDCMRSSLKALFEADEDMAGDIEETLKKQRKKK